MKTKTIKAIRNFALVIILPVSLNISGYVDLFNRIFNTNKMSMIEIIQLIAMPFVFLAIYIYYDRKFEKQKQHLIEYVRKLYIGDIKICDAYDEFHWRKMQYLFNCIKSGTILLEPKKTMTNYEIELLKEWAKDADLEIEKIEQKINANLSNIVENDE